MVLTVFNGVARLLNNTTEEKKEKRYYALGGINALVVPRF